MRWLNPHLLHLTHLTEYFSQHHFGVLLYLTRLWLEKGSLLSDRQMYESVRKCGKSRDGHTPISIEVVVFVNTMDIVISATLPSPSKYKRTISIQGQHCNIKHLHIL